MLSLSAGLRNKLVPTASVKSPSPGVGVQALASCDTPAADLTVIIRPGAR
ncbi:hypothetical protein RZS08_07470 [Arthrospira platensis SPKY1]|nr:hypothetical protein [Arthrospira platensis SPKY1]